MFITNKTVEQDDYTDILTCKSIRFMKWGYQHKDYNIYYFRYEDMRDRPTILCSRGILQCNFVKMGNIFYNKLIPVVFKQIDGIYSFAALTRSSEFGRIPVFVNEEFANEWIDDAYNIDITDPEEYSIIVNEACYFIEKIEKFENMLKKESE